MCASELIHFVLTALRHPVSGAAFCVHCVGRDMPPKANPGAGKLAPNRQFIPSACM